MTESIEYISRFPFSRFSLTQTMLRTSALGCAFFSIAAFSMAEQSLAAPVGGVVSEGQASIDQNGSFTQVHQSSHRAVIDWRRFDLAAGEHVDFQQPSSSAVTLNRVHDVKASQIHGRITANGHVMIVNPNGVVFGKGAAVDVNGLTVSSADISNENFMAGRMVFDKAGRADAAIVNHGRITARQAGLVGLVAPSVENHGVIQAKLGRVALASGDSFTLDMYGDDLIKVKASGALHTQLVRNAKGGVIEADGGVIQLTAAQARSSMDAMVVNEGTLQARSVSEQGGRIILGAGGGDVYHSGMIDVSGLDAGQRGGDVAITGNRIALLDGSMIDARGVRGGGDVKVGGDYQGKGDMQRAQRSVMQAGAKIDASATGKGDGGEVILWADDRTDFHGSIASKGGARGGDGGLVETSGKEVLSASGSVDASAAKGQAGQWLLDPMNVTIQDAADGGDADIDNTTGAGGADVFSASADSAVVTTESLEASLNAGTDVLVQTSGGGSQEGDITVNGKIEKTAGGDATLTLKAHNAIIVNEDITSTNGKLHVILHADSDSSNAGYIKIDDAQIISNSGDIVMGGGADVDGDGRPDGYAVGTSASVDGVLIKSGSYAVLGSDGNVTYHNARSVIDSGSGMISIKGKGYDNNSLADGVSIESTRLRTSGDQGVVIDGQASSGISGVYLYRSEVVSAGDGGIDIKGMRVGHAANGVGVRILQSLLSTAGDGDITVFGAIENGLYSTKGLSIGLTHIHALGDGDIRLTGINRSQRKRGVYQSNNDGLNLETSDIRRNEIVAKGDGDVRLKGVLGHGDASLGVRLYNSRSRRGRRGLVETEGAGDVFLACDLCKFEAYNIRSAHGDITWNPATRDANVGLFQRWGDIFLNGSTYSAMRSVMQADNGVIYFGADRSGSGGLRVGARDWGGSDIGLTAGSGGLRFMGRQRNLGFLRGMSAGDIILNNRITARGAGDAIVFSAAGRFVNNSGARALTTSSGRYLVYVGDEADVQLNGLAAAAAYGTAYGDDVSALSGNHFVYASAAPVVTPPPPPSPPSPPVPPPPSTPPPSSSPTSPPRAGGRTDRRAFEEAHRVARQARRMRLSNKRKVGKIVYHSVDELSEPLLEVSQDVLAIPEAHSEPVVIEMVQSSGGETSDVPQIDVSQNEPL